MIGSLSLQTRTRKDLLQKRISTRTPLETARDNVERQALSALDRGDRNQAITILVREYGAEILRYCQWLLGGDSALAEDTCQVVFLNAYQSLETFRGSSRLRTWLLGIARHRCINAIKKKRRCRETNVGLSGTLPDVPAMGAGADEQLGTKQLGAALERHLARLDPKVRTLILMRYQEGLGYKEISRLFNERPEALQMRAARAIARLSRKLSRVAAE